MNEDLLKESEIVLRKLDSIEKFHSRYNVVPYREAGKLVDVLKKLAENIPEIKAPENEDELIQSELKRRLNGEALSLEQRITARKYDFDTIISIYAIPKEDICCLKDWLLENKETALEAIERLYQTKDVQNYDLDLPADIPSVKRQAEEFAAIHIQKYHKRLGKLLMDLTRVGEFLRDIDAVPTSEGRSYFHTLTNTLAIGIPAICYTNEDGSLQIRERDLITLYGHEGMGHALNQVVTKANGLPYFLKKNTRLTSATMESVAQFYQKMIFQDLKKSPQTQKDLGIEHKFDEIYQDAEDSSVIHDFRIKFLQYAVTVIADKSLGDPQDSETVNKKIQILNEVTIDPTFPTDFVESKRFSFDSDGNFDHTYVSELRYCAQSVKRALEEFSKQGIKYEGQGRSKIDSVLLKGFWTPIGYVDNARLRAKEK